MNGHKILVGAILLILCAACLLQGSITGCSRASTDDAQAAAESTDGETPFFRRTGGDGPINWRPVSDAVLEQITEMPRFSHLEIQSIERGDSGDSAMRCSIGHRSNYSEEKQLLDGLYLMQCTFPEQELYFVRLDESDDCSVQSDWDTMEAIVEEGYTFDVSGEEARSYWRRFIESNATEDPAAGRADTTSSQSDSP
jgi:hypothetical protein